MIVFKNYLKLLRGAYPSIIIFLIITIAITMLSMSSSVQQTDFMLVKPKIVIINQDKGALANGLEDFLNEKTIVIEMAEAEIKDALFFNEIECAVIIKENFFETVNKNEEAVEILKAVAMTGALQVEILINKYLNIADIYVKSEIAESEMVTYLKKDLKNEVTTTFLVDEEQTTTVSSMRFYFNFISYSFLATIIASVALIMRVYNEKNIKMRSMCAPISFKKYNTQIIMGNIVVALGFWVAFMGLAFVIFQDALFTNSGWLMILNAFIFAQVALAIAYIIGSFVKSNEVQNGLAQVIALASSFIGGAFVPQFILGSTVLLVARITPTYWYARNNDLLSEPFLNNMIMKEYFINLAVLGGFIIVIYGSSLYIRNKYVKYIN